MQDLNFRVHRNVKKNNFLRLYVILWKIQKQTVSIESISVSEVHLMYSPSAQETT